MRRRLALNATGRPAFLVPLADARGSDRGQRHARKSCKIECDNRRKKFLETLASAVTGMCWGSSSFWWFLSETGLTFGAWLDGVFLVCFGIARAALIEISLLHVRAFGRGFATPLAHQAGSPGIRMPPMFQAGSRQ